MKNKSFNTIITKNNNKYFCFIRKARKKDFFHYSAKINNIDGCVLIAGNTIGKNITTKNQVVDLLNNSL